MSKEGVVNWNEAAMESLLNGPGGPVAKLIWDLSVRASLMAISTVHVRPGTRKSATTGRTSSARRPGYTKARIRPHLAWGPSTGQVYGGVNAPANPSILLEEPARQMDRPYPFLTTALWSLEGTF